MPKLYNGFRHIFYDIPAVPAICCLQFSPYGNAFRTKHVLSRLNTRMYAPSITFALGQTYRLLLFATCEFQFLRDNFTPRHILLRLTY